MTPLPRAPRDFTRRHFYPTWLSIACSAGIKQLRSAFLSARLKNGAGFTLIETFVAITILLTAIAGPLTIASRGLSSAFLAKQQTVASFLAQEGIEYIRYKRDTNVLNGQSWLQNLSACTNATCYVNAVTDDIIGCSGECPPLRFNASSGFYTYALSDPASEFTRSVRISTIGSDEAQIVSVVTWSTGSVIHRFTAAENIFNWQ